LAGVFAAGDCVNFLKHVPGAVNEGFLAGAETYLQLTAEDLEIAKNAVTKWSFSKPSARE